MVARVTGDQRAPALEPVLPARLAARIDKKPPKEAYGPLVDGRSKYTCASNLAPIGEVPTVTVEFFKDRARVSRRNR